MKEQPIKNFIRGGQIFFHSIRMFLQVAKPLLAFSLIIFILWNSYTLYRNTQSFERYITEKWLYAGMLSLINENVTLKFKDEKGNVYTIPAGQFKYLTHVQQIVQHVKALLVRSLMFSTITLMLLFINISVWLMIRGKHHTASQTIKGDELTDAKIVKRRIIKQKNASNITVSNIKLPLIKNSECQHLLAVGSTGTGKSTLIKEMMTQIQARGDRAIIYDKSGDFLQTFYRPDKDILLNPLDQRGQPWHLWQECQHQADFDSLANALIPQPSNASDPFWVDAARALFATTAHKMRSEQKPSIQRLLGLLLTSEITELEKYLEGTDVKKLVSEKMAKTALSITSVLATYLKSFKWIRDEGEPFSIRNWVADDHSHQWLYLTSFGDHHETLKPLLSMWLDIAVKSILSLPASRNRRIWIFLDELGSLQALPYLSQLAAEGRKFGACLVVGLQSIAQLERVYGRAGAHELSSLLNTRFIFRQADPTMAKWAALNLGSTWIKQVNEGISYGAHRLRDGVSIQQSERLKPVVHESEIMRLKDLHCYLRLPGAYPITQLTFDVQKRPTLAQPFIGRTSAEKSPAQPLVSEVVAPAPLTEQSAAASQTPTDPISKHPPLKKVALIGP